MGANQKSPHRGLWPRAKQEQHPHSSPCKPHAMHGARCSFPRGAISTNLAAMGEKPLSESSCCCIQRVMGWRAGEHPFPSPPLLGNPPTPGRQRLNSRTEKIVRINLLVSNYAFGCACSPRTDFNESLAFTCADVGLRCLQRALKPGGAGRCEMLGAASSAPRRAGSEVKRIRRAQRGMSEPATSLRVGEEIKGRSSQLKKKTGKHVLSFQETAEFTVT